MSISIITGASRGLGLALDPCARRTGLDARRGRPRRARPARGHARPRRRRRRWRATSPTRAPGDGSSRRPATGSTSSSTTPARSGRARSPRSPLPARRAAPRRRGERARPARSRPGRAASPGSRRGPRRERELRRRRRGVPGLGRLRVLEGGAGAPERDPRRASTRACASTRSTPATCAPGCTRRRSPTRTSPTGRRRRTACPASSRSSRGRCRAAATGHAELRRRAMSTIAFAETPRHARARSAALLVATRADGAIVQTRFADLPRAAARGRPARGQHLGDAPRRAARDARRRRGALHLSTPLADGRWVVELRTAELGRCDPPRSRATWPCPAAGA